MQTQASVLDIGGGALSVKSAPVKAGGDEGQFAETLRDQLQGAQSPEPRPRAAAPAANSSSKAQESEHETAQQEAQGEAEGAQQSSFKRSTDETVAKRGQGPSDTEAGSALPLALPQQNLPPQPLHPLHLALTLQQGEGATLDEPVDTTMVAPFALAALPPQADGDAASAADVAALPAKGAAVQIAGNLADKGTLVADSGAAEERAAADASLAANATYTKIEQGKETGSFNELLAAMPAAGDGQPEPPQATLQGASPLTAASPAAVTGNSSPLPPTLSVANPVPQPQWRSEVGERLLWMVKQEVQEAQLQLNPRHLGPIEVRIAMHNDQATVQFIAHHGATREALEAALPRLRDMFQEAGLQMNNSSVFSQEQFQQHQQQAAAGGREGRGTPLGRGADGVDNSAPLALVESALPLRGIDYYA